MTSVSQQKADRMRKFLTVFGVSLALLTGYANPASATNNDPDECVPADAYVQHYSWTGGRRATDNPPLVTPPHEDWQANTKSEPHENGNGNPATWVNASLHYTANSQGHASWFYLEFVPAVECPPPSSTTTTSTTSTTVPETTTTTVPETTTTVPEATTSTVIDPTTTTVGGPTTITPVPVTTVTESRTPLPRTGPAGLFGLVLLASGLITVGAKLRRAAA